MGLWAQILEKNYIKLGLNNVYLKRYFKKQAAYPSKLAEVGRFQEVKVQGIYDPGQLFFHRIFGYRGVILFAWKAKVFDRDAKQESQQKHSLCSSKDLQSGLSLHKNDMEMSAGENNESSGTASCNQRSTGSAELAGKLHTFYQALIDARDCPHIRAQTEAVTFLGNQDTTRSLYAIPGLDYVAHDDIMPYSSTEKNPLHHELFDKFLEYAPERHPPFVALETLKAWQDKYNLWLELSDVHIETTENIRITVIPFYMGCRDSPSTSVYWWRYCIRIENHGSMSVQLRERHWRIFSLSGTLETVRGRGVVGQEPILSTRLPAFQYSSHVSLQAPSGHMWGTFRLEREDGYTFDCKIPPFSLESKSDESLTPEPSEPDIPSKTNNKKNENKDI